MLADKYPVSDSKASIAKGNRATTRIGKNGENKLAIFRYNPGKQQVIYPPKHPYLAKENSPQAVKEAKEVVQQVSQWRDFVQVRSFDGGGSYAEHISIDVKANDYTLVRNIGVEFARMGSEVKATPKLHFKSPEYKAIYGSLIGTRYERKCPDLLVNGKFYEVESFVPPFSKHKIGNMIKKGLLQSDRIIINNTRGCSDRYIKKLIIDRIKKGQHIKQVWVYEKGKIRLLH